MTPSRDDVLQAMLGHEHTGLIAARVATILLAAAEQQRVDCVTGPSVAELKTDSLPELRPEDAETPYGNVLAILDAGATTHSEWLLLSCALARAVAERFDDATQRGESDLRRAAWLAAQTPCNAFLFLDDWLKEEQRESCWSLLTAWLTQDELPREQRVAVMLGLYFATSPTADEQLNRVHDAFDDPAGAALLERRMTTPALDGELLPQRRGRVLTVLQAISGWMFLRSVTRLIARYTLGLRRRGRLLISAQGVRVQHHVSLLGRTVRQGERFLPHREVVSLEREARFADVGLYAGLFALALGTYVGTGLILDGLRVTGGSPSLLGLGLGFVVLGIALDFLLSRLSSIRGGRVRLVIEARSGNDVTLGGLDPAQVEGVFGRLKAFRLESD